MAGYDVFTYSGLNNDAMIFHALRLSDGFEVVGLIKPDNSVEVVRVFDGDSHQVILVRS